MMFKAHNLTGTARLFESLASGRAVTAPCGQVCYFYYYYYFYY